MAFWTNLLSGGAGSLVDSLGNVADKFITTDAEKNEFKLQMESLVQKRESELAQSIRAEMQAKERITTAELQQGDNYTKRARPTVVYFGLLVILINYVLFPMASRFLGLGIAESTPLALPPEFCSGWSGIVATWSVGRSFEKRGVTNTLTRKLTGSFEPAKAVG